MLKLPIKPGTARTLSGDIVNGYIAKFEDVNESYVRIYRITDIQASFINEYGEVVMRGYDDWEIVDPDTVRYTS